MPINIDPKPGVYENPVSIKISHKSDRIFYSFGPDIEELECWIARNPAPNPVRSHSSLLSDNLVGGLSENKAISLNSHYKNDSWTSEVDALMPIHSSGSSQNILSCGYSHDQTNMTSEWEDGSWKMRCPAPKRNSGHNLESLDNIYSLNGRNNNIYKYDKKSDSWMTVGRNRFSSSYSASSASNNKIYFTNKNLYQYDPDKETVSLELNNNFVQGSASTCKHNGHFLIVGGHSESILSNVSRVDLNRRVVISQPPSVPGAYMASNSHRTIAGVSRNNVFYEYLCAFDWFEYKNPIPIKNGKYSLYVVCIDNDFNITAHDSLEYEIRLNRATFKIVFSPNCFTIIEWPKCLKADGGEFYFKDIMPDDCIVELENGKLYTKTILEDYPVLDFKLEPDIVYKFRSKNSEKTIYIDAILP